jgi:tetratricopeptide (TPR) repeat protein
MSFLAKLNGDFEPSRYAFRRFVFGMALREYLAIPEEDREESESDLEFRLGRCRKCCGDYDAAIRHLETAARARREDAGTLAELADAYALSGELRSSKALFREAFYLDASGIELAFLESEMIRRLAERVAALPVEGNLIPEWIPVYGTLYGVFTVKRELRQVEVGKLKQSISELERDYKDNPKDVSPLKPRLINRYFWLVDHYESIGEAHSRIDEILLKIRLLDQSVYALYTA